MEYKPENRVVKRCKTSHSYSRTKLKLPIYISAYAISPHLNYQEVELAQDSRMVDRCSELLKKPACIKILVTRIHRKISSLKHKHVGKNKDTKALNNIMNGPWRIPVIIYVLSNKIFFKMS